MEIEIILLFVYQWNYNWANHLSNDINKDLEKDVNEIAKSLKVIQSSLVWLGKQEQR